MSFADSLDIGNKDWLLAEMDLPVNKADKSIVMKPIDTTNAILEMYAFLNCKTSIDFLPRSSPQRIVKTENED